MRSHGYHVVNPETVLLHGSLRHPSPMQGVLMDDAMQGGLWATCTSLPKRAGFGWVEKKKEAVTMCDHLSKAAYL